MAEIPGCPRVSVSRHVHRWSEKGVEAARDHRGGNKSPFTEKMLKDIDVAYDSPARSIEPYWP